MTDDETAADPVLRVRGLDIGFAGDRGLVPVVHGVDLDVAPGELVALLGESGSGKTVTARAIMGIQDPAAVVTTRELTLSGTELSTLDEPRRRAVRGERMSMVMQDALSSLNPVLSIGDQIGEVLRVHRGIGRRPARARVKDLLGLVGIADPRRNVDAYPHQFSGGMRQRILIAMAIALEPELLIADEPTTALDVTVQAQILRLMHGLRSQLDMSVLLITHDIGVVTEVADRLAVMNRGVLVEEGDADEVFAAPQQDYTRRLLAAAPTDGPTRVLGRAGTTVLAGGPVGSGGSTGRGSAAEPATSVDGAGEPEVVLQLRGITRTFTAGSPISRRTTRAVVGVDADLRRGETLGVVGESGSGKSTLARIVVGLESADAGTVSYRGRDVTRRTRAGFGSGGRGGGRGRPVQMVFQDPYTSLDPRMRVRDVVAEPWAVTGQGTRASRRDRVAELLGLVGLSPDVMDRFPHQFSGGQRQRIGIARSLMRDPDVLVCDEPVSALDVTIQAQITGLLVDLQERLGLSIVFISHDLSVVRELAHRVLVMYRGEVVESGDTAQIFHAPTHDYTRTLLASIPPATRAERGRLTAA